jgi:hypothetical protein
MCIDWCRGQGFPFSKKKHENLARVCFPIEEATRDGSILCGWCVLSITSIAIDCVLARTQLYPYNHHTVDYGPWRILCRPSNRLKSIFQIWSKDKKIIGNYCWPIYWATEYIQSWEEIFSHLVVKFRILYVRYLSMKN